MDNFAIYNDPILSKKRKGDVSDPFKKITETLWVDYGYVVLTETPNRFERVLVTGASETLYEIESGELKENTYKVDYTHGAVFFHSSLNKKSLTFTYLGEGVLFFPDSRIYLTGDKNYGNARNKFSDLDRGILEQKNRVDNLIRSTPQPSELVDTRVDRNGKVFSVAKDRIDAEQKKIEDAYVDLNEKTHSSLKERINAEQFKIEETYFGKDGKSYVSMRERFDKTDDKIYGLDNELSALDQNFNILKGKFERRIVPLFKDLLEIDASPGEHVKTLGYYEIGDGGGAEYFIQSTDKPPINGFAIQMNNGLHAYLLSQGIVTPRQFGAKGDGSNDDTSAFNKAIDYLSSIGGGTLYIPKDKNSTYLLNSYVILKDNINILSNGAKITKNGTSKDYYAFVTLSGDKTGYGSGGSNISIKGLTFSGSFSDSIGISITMHHSDNILIERCTFKEAIITGHAIDLGGCSNVMIKECIFEGFDIKEGREYTEAIQIDHSIAEGIGIDNASSYDGLACENVTVRDSVFLPLNINGTEYPAPNPFGSHSRVVGHNFKNIRFENNYVKNGSTLPVGTPYAAGWLHFYHVDGLQIIGNTFENKTNNSARVLGLYSIGTAIAQNDVSNPTPVKIDYQPVPAKNVIFSENKMVGFRHSFVGRIIYLQGREVATGKYYLNNIKITNNSFIDCYDTNAAELNVSSDSIFADKVDGLYISGNYCSSVRRLLYATESKRITITDNQMIGAFWVPISIRESIDVNISNNSIDNFRGGIYTYLTERLKINGNILSNLIDGPEEAYYESYGSIISINNGKNFIIKENDMHSKGSTVIKGFYIYNGSVNGRMKHNFFEGFATNYEIGEDSVNVVAEN